jgi:hypothetical protein
MKKPDLLVLVAVWEFIAAFLALVSMVAAFIIGFTAMAYRYNFNHPAGRIDYFTVFVMLSVAAVVLLIYIAIAVTAGVGLLRGKEWGRIASIILAALSVFCVPFGTVIGVLVLIYLTRPSVRDYFTKQVIVISPVPSETPLTPTSPPGISPEAQEKPPTV